MIIDSLLIFFLVVFSLCSACFRLQLYSCYYIIFAAYSNIAAFLCNVYLWGERGLGQCYIILGGSEVESDTVMGRDHSFPRHAEF